MAGLSLQPYDIGMVVVILLATGFGAWKGMAWQLAALASLVVSVVVAVRLSEPVAPYISAQAPWNRFIAMLILYVATSLAIWLAFRLVAGIIDRVKLREFDRQIGAIFGFAKGVLWCMLITFFAVTLSEPARQAILKTRSGRYIAVILEKGTPLLPEEVRKLIGKYLEEFDRKLDPKTPPEQPAELSDEPLLAAPEPPAPQPRSPELPRAPIPRGLQPVE